jgi:L-ascorbate metabolism protein UlaG (beta-lactamase superfamily)
MIMKNLTTCLIGLIVSTGLAQSAFSQSAWNRRVDFALVSHVHADHFQPAPAHAFLAASPETLLATSPQVLAELSANVPANVPTGSTTAGTTNSTISNTQAVMPQPGTTSTTERAGFSVQFLNLSHGTGRFAEIQNLGHVITIGGQRVLHLGDAAMDIKNFAANAASLRDIDVALVPYWYFGYEPGRALIEQHLQAVHTIACHIPSAEREEFAREVAESHPGVIAYGDALQSWTFPARKR